ncbi:MAG: MHS family MFS transporter [Lentisphaerae bacterium]|nr:MHS family MFS transporter [Lentisphaerota bacterium]MCP4103232.1 MHS family MFS transporter [Lentisphaerota bacterium]
MKLRKKDIQVFVVSSIGGALEFYDFIIFVFFAYVFSKHFFSKELSGFIQLLSTYVIFAVGYFVRPVGGVILAHFGDRYGRKKIFYLSILLMGISTLAIGLLPSYSHIGSFAPVFLLFLRVCQGFALGGELPGATAFVYEHLEERFKGLGVGLLYSGLLVGILTGSLVSAIIFKCFTKSEVLDYAWRIPFIFGGILAFIGVYLRRNMQETPVFLEIERRKKLEKIPVITLFKSYKINLFKGFVNVLMAATETMVFLIFLPAYLKSVYKYESGDIFIINSFCLLVAIIATPVLGLFAYRFKRLRVFYLSTLLVLLISLPVFYFIANNKLASYTVFLMIIGVLTGGILTYPLLLIRYFKAEIRVSGLSFCLNVAFALAGTIPALTTFLNEVLQIKHSLLLILIAVSTVTLVTFFLPVSGSSEQEKKAFN